MLLFLNNAVDKGFEPLPFSAHLFTCITCPYRTFFPNCLFCSKMLSSFSASAAACNRNADLNRYQYFTNQYSDLTYKFSFENSCNFLKNKLSIIQQLWKRGASWFLQQKVVKELMFNHAFCEEGHCRYKRQIKIAVARRKRQIQALYT